MMASSNLTFAAHATILLCLLGASQSAPTDCERLVRPLHQVHLHHLEGGWAFIAGSINNSRIMEALKQRGSIAAYFSNSSETHLSYTQVNRITGQCQQRSYNISFQGSTFSLEGNHRFQLNGSFLFTSCPDCAVMRWVVNSARRQTVDLYLLSRRRTLEPEVMEEFKAQVNCLQLPPPAVMDPSEELCPEPQEHQEPTAVLRDGNNIRKKHV